MIEFHNFKDKTLLITGGTGSFGNAVLGGFLDSEISTIRIFSRDEKKQDDMRRKFSDSRIEYYIGNVRDRDRVDQVMKGVDYVFHAAALKQVPSCEFYPLEAVKTNVIGTENVLESAINNSVEKVICLSTDKAVYPINAMGMSKALMEKVLISKSRISKGGTVICGTRYGNVMGSRGSVIPLFIKQIETGMAITITDPEMTRFMMSLQEAVDLVIYAFTNGSHGDIFVRKSPAATIQTLAETLKEMYDSDSTEISYIGTRHSEKKYESLLTHEEMSRADDCGEYYKIFPDQRGLNYDTFYSEGSVDIVKEEYNSNNTHRLSKEELRVLLEKVGFSKK
ncbi:MAG: polysaccharide biosynthesis protein [Candidatus Magasanikbacteria bacterium]